MKPKLLNSSYKHYRRQADGTLKFVGEVAYTHTVAPAPDFDTMLKEYLGYDARKARVAAEAATAKTRAAAEDLERLADLASETEG